MCLFLVGQRNLTETETSMGPSRGACTITCQHINHNPKINWFGLGVTFELTLGIDG